VINVATKHWTHASLIHRITGNPKESLGRTVPGDLNRLASIPKVMWIQTLYDPLSEGDPRSPRYEAATQIAGSVELFSGHGGYGAWSQFIHGNVDGIPPHDVSRPEYTTLISLLMSYDPEAVLMFLYRNLPVHQLADVSSLALRAERVASARKLAHLEATVALREELGREIRTEDRPLLKPRQFMSAEAVEIVEEFARDGGWPGQLYAYFVVLRAARAPVRAHDPRGFARFWKRLCPSTSPGVRCQYPSVISRPGEGDR
jgi:hypothetical protein